MLGVVRELKRRNVIRVALAYVVAGWVVIQAVDMAADIFDAPGWVMQMTLALLAVGLLPVLILSWVFEITPEGIKRESELPAEAGDRQHTAWRLNVAIVLLLAVAIALLLGDRFFERAPPATTTVDTPPQSAQDWRLDSIAVLPFADFSPDRSQAWLGEGIAETLLHTLAQVDGLRVSARTSSFAYRDRAADVGTIGRELGVATVLEGSVQRAGDRLRVVAQLVRTDTQDHVFSKTFDRDAGDIFAIQDEIAQAVAKALTGRAADTQAGMARTDVNVYDLYLEGRQLWQERTPESVDRAVELLEQAVSADPDYGPAHSELATALLFQHFYGEAELEANRAAIERHTERALALNAEDSQAWATRGLLLQELDLQAEGMEALKSAERLAASDANIQVWLGNRYHETARFEEAAGHFERALELDPLNRWVRGRYIDVLGMLNPYDPRIERIARDTVRLFPDEPGSWRTLLTLMDNRGRVDEMALIGLEAHTRHPQELPFSWYVHSSLTALDETAAAEAWLARIRSIEPDATPWSMYYLRSDPERHLELAREEYEKWGEGMLPNLMTSLRINHRFDEAWELLEHHLADTRAAFASREAGIKDYNLLIEGMWLARQRGNESGYDERLSLFLPRYQAIRNSDVFMDDFVIPDILLATVSGDHETATAMLDEVPHSSLSYLAWAMTTDPMFEPIRDRDEAIRLVKRYEAELSAQKTRLEQEAPPELFDPTLLPPIEASEKL